ncbi:60S ribosomal protein L3 [Piedraia hortae CBS 480.64]|uniref:Large ribosomal subunit protein mL44 n=1 Tax=Piedraia hortae CBS 480.64 TaxID=1314780 RepID=A0A6A7C2K0_9PEZI|nr:60S ribosomal protein L3 [Piedraia hortae CBS 480.64]
MKRLGPDRWVSHIQPPRNPWLISTFPLHQADRQRRRRNLSTAAAEAPATQQSPTPSLRRARQSPKLSALHARLQLPARLPVETLARCLVDKSVDPRPGFNNAPLAVLGQDLLGLLSAEWLMCRYPRLPMAILFAAQNAYVGDAALASMRAEWGVELVAYPGSEVDPGMLQFKRMDPANSVFRSNSIKSKDEDAPFAYPRGMSSRIVHDDQFGVHDKASYKTGTEPDGAQEPVTDEKASSDFVRALTGALHVHAGLEAVKTFHSNHVLSRFLQLDKLFQFTHATRHLSRLCAREGFESPVARLISESGRLSRSPVFIVGVYSGNDKLGEGAGTSLNEARVRASVAALKSWYLYSPPGSSVMMPSETLAEPGAKQWRPQYIDIGEITG